MGYFSIKNSVCQAPLTFLFEQDTISFNKTAEINIMAIQERFTGKAKLEKSLIDRFGSKDLTKRKHKEMGDLPGEVKNLVLYYSKDVHVGTWNSTGRGGWSFDIKVA